MATKRTDVMMAAGRGTGGGATAVHDQSGVAGCIAADTALICPGGEGIAAADWLDVTHAMLSSVDDCSPALG